MEEALKRQLEDHPFRHRVMNNEFFAMARTSRVTMHDVGDFLGQYWRPIHYFAAFLGRVIAAIPYVEIQTVVSRILWQELGEGVPARAHEVIYVDTMTRAGFDRRQVCDSPANAATQALMRGYQESTGDYCRALGFLYGTEIIDLTIVKGLGEAVQRATGHENLAWVNIHVVQEPDHVVSANESMKRRFTDAERRSIVDSAALHWELWDGFFTTLHRNATAGARSGAHA